MTGKTATFDKDYTRRYWRDRGAYWDGSADSLAEVADRLNQPLLDAIGVAPGQAVLDCVGDEFREGERQGRRVRTRQHTEFARLARVNRRVVR
jgi:hypothetical protein